MRALLSVSDKTGLVPFAAALVAAGTGIERVGGAIAPGGTFTIWSQAAPGRGFKTRVTELTAPSSMEWTGGMPAGLFRGVRRLSLIHI